MESTKKKTPDYTDIAYREAVARLRFLLAESYSPQATPTKVPHVHMTKPDDSGDETDASAGLSERSRQIIYRRPYFSSRRNLYADSLPKLSHAGSTLNVPGTAEMADGAIKSDGQHPPPELMAFIERQEEYIEQLEKESQYCREELSSLLSKVKEVISENEGLHEKEKSGLLKSVFEHFESEEDDGEHDKTDKRKSPSKKKRLEGPSIVFESRISELEAQLTQTKIELRKAQEEADLYKKKLAEVHPHCSDGSMGPTVDSYRQQIEALQREKEELSENLAKLSSAVNQIRDKESDSSQKVKRSLDLVDQAQFEKAQAELEVRRLKDELDRQHDKLRDLLQEQGRRIQEERVQAERRYAQQIEQLSADLTAQWDAASKLQLELEKQRRIETDLRRELQQKNVMIDELKKELQTKVAGLQSEATQSAAERGSLEQELAASRLMAERAEREARQESSRLQAEVTALRQRLDRADSDLLHSRRENLRLSEQVASLEREVNLAKMMKESSDKVASDTAPSTSSPSKHAREKELTSMIMDMEAKHVSTVAELESMIQSQNQLMEKLKDECHTLTQKLEDSSARHKEEKGILREENAVLLGKLEQIWTNFKQLERESIEFGVCSRSKMENQTTPMLKSATQEPSMAFKHSMRHSHRNTSHSYSMSPNQSTNLSLSMKPNSLSQDTNPNLKQDMNPSQSISHSQGTNPSQNTKNPSQNMNPNQTISSMNLSQNMTLSQDIRQMGNTSTPNRNSTPNQIMDLSQEWSPLSSQTTNPLGTDLNQEWNPLLSQTANQLGIDLSQEWNPLSSQTMNRLGTDLNREWNLQSSQTSTPLASDLRRGWSPKPPLLNPTTVPRVGSGLSQGWIHSPLVQSQSMGPRLGINLHQEWSPKPQLQTQIMDSRQSLELHQEWKAKPPLLNPIMGSRLGTNLCRTSHANQITPHRPVTVLHHEWNHSQPLLNPLQDSGVSQVESFNQGSGLSQPETNRVLSHSQALSHIPVLGPNQVSNPSRVSELNSLEQTLSLASGHQNPNQLAGPSQAYPSLDHLPLSPPRREVDRPPLTLEDLATDSDSFDSQSAQLRVFS